MSIPSNETMEHLTHLLGYFQSKEYKSQDPSAISGILKRSIKPEKNNKSKQSVGSNELPEYNFKSIVKKRDMRITNFEVENHKLEWVGLNFGRDEAAKIQIAVR